MNNRSFTVNVFCGENQRVVQSIRRYRAGCRQLFAVLGCAQAAGAVVVSDDDNVSLKPDTAQAQNLLRQIFNLGEEDKAAGMVYACRRWWLSAIYPLAYSFVWDSARRQVVTRWTAKDPEFPRAGRGWLILQGVRGVAEFQRVGIEFPQATARPKLLARSIVLRWDKELGEVEFHIGGLDNVSWHTWSQIRSGSKPAGTVILNECKGQLRATISYAKPEEAVSLEPTQILHVSLAGQLLELAGPDGALDVIGLNDAIGVIEKLRKQTTMWEARKACTGNPRRPWGNKKAWSATVVHLGRVTLNRTRFVTDQNHAWSRRIATRMRSWGCSKVIFKKPEGLAGHPWNWSQFQEFLRYKAEEIGGSLAVAASEITDITDITGAPSPKSTTSRAASPV